MKRVVIFIYLFILLIFSVFSYSQIDLNLTISANPSYQIIQKLLIQLGYYNRPLSTAIYAIILICLSVCYILILKNIKDKKIDKQVLVRLIIYTGLILFFAYSAFSHDIFNYMFDARIITKYQLNPYYYKALDFPFDLWTRFMHWTHRTYPYGPVWVLITMPFSYLGFQKFTPTLLLFKLLFLSAYYLCCYLIYLITAKNNSSDNLYSVAFFAFNPLVLIEGILSPHNDMVMLLFALLGIYFLVNRNNITSLIFNLLSAGIKFITFPLIILNIYFLLIKPKVISLGRISAYCILSYLLGIIFVIYFREVLPWYSLPLIGFSALTNNKFIRFIIPVLSFGLLTKYIPFLYLGEWVNQSYRIFLLFNLVLLSASGLIYLSIKKLNILKLKS